MENKIAFISLGVTVMIAFSTLLYGYASLSAKVNTMMERKEIVELVIRHKTEAKQLADKSYYIIPDVDERFMNRDQLGVHLEYTKDKLVYLERKIDEK